MMSGKGKSWKETFYNPLREDFLTMAGSETNTLGPTQKNPSGKTGWSLLGPIADKDACLVGQTDDGNRLLLYIHPL